MGVIWKKIGIHVGGSGNPFRSSFQRPILQFDIQFLPYMRSFEEFPLFRFQFLLHVSSHSSFPNHPIKCSCLVFSPQFFSNILPTLFFAQSFPSLCLSRSFHMVRSYPEFLPLYNPFPESF